MPKPSSGSGFTSGGMPELEAAPPPNMLMGTAAAVAQFSKADSQEGAEAQQVFRCRAYFSHTPKGNAKGWRLAIMAIVARRHSSCQVCR